RFWRLPPRFMARKHGESGPAIAAPNRGGNVDPKCLILSPFLRLPLRSSMRWAGFLTGRIYRDLAVPSPFLSTRFGHAWSTLSPDVRHKNGKVRDIADRPALIGRL